MGPDVGMLMDYEAGDLSDPDVLRLFAGLIGSGMAWTLQGHYGRTATSLLEVGFIDPWGNITERGQDAINEYEDEYPGEDCLS